MPTRSRMASRLTTPLVRSSKRPSSWARSPTGVRDVVDRGTGAKARQSGSAAARRASDLLMLQSLVDNVMGAQHRRGRPASPHLPRVCSSSSRSQARPGDVSFAMKSMRMRRLMSSQRHKTAHKSPVFLATSFFPSLPYVCTHVFIRHLPLLLVDTSPPLVI